MVLQADGKSILAGYTILQTEINMAMVRFDTEGNLDSTFGNDGMVSFDFEGREDYGQSIALQDDNKIIMSGYSYGGGGSEFEIVRFLNDDTAGTEDFQNLEFRLYPNPANEQITIELKDASTSYDISIFDVLGKKVYASEIQKSENIDVSSLAQGTYMLKINSENKTKVLRFIKQ